MLGELRALLNTQGRDIAASPVSAAGLAELLDLIDARGDQRQAGQRGVGESVRERREPGAVVAREGIAQMSDAGELERVVDEVIAANPKAVEDYRAGKTSALGNSWWAR